MRTSTSLYAQQRVIYHPELLMCPHCSTSCLSATLRMGVDLALFDCDGVLVDSEPAGNDTMGTALREVGLGADTIERDVFGQYFGKGLSDVVMWERIEAYVGELPDGIQEAFQSYEKVAMASVKAIERAAWCKCA